MGALVWKLLGTGAAVLAASAATKALAVGWKTATGKKPPINPENPDTSLAEALGWAVVSGALIGTARMLATRKAAQYYLKSSGHLPKGLEAAAE